MPVQRRMAFRRAVWLAGAVFLLGAPGPLRADPDPENAFSVSQTNSSFYIFNNGPVSPYCNGGTAFPCTWSIGIGNINAPNNYGGWYRYYTNPLGSPDTQTSWDHAGITIQQVTSDGQGNFTLGSGTPEPWPLPEPTDSAVFGYLGPTGPVTGAVPPGYLQGATMMEDAYTVNLGGQTYAEIIAGFFGAPSDSKITFNLGGTATATYDIRLEGQNIAIQGNGTLTTGGTLYVAGNVNATGGKLQGGTVIIAPGIVAAAQNNAYAGTSGAVTINGTGSIWNVKQSLAIGAGGTGTVTVSGGGTLVVNGSSLYIGQYAQSSGTLLLDGSGSQPTPR
jgi:T5SS/PEP-CTERM-associated repeat protein